MPYDNLPTNITAGAADHPGLHNRGNSAIHDLDARVTGIEDHPVLGDDLDAARTAIGLGTAATQSAGAFASSVQGEKADSAVQPDALENKANLAGGKVPLAELPAATTDAAGIAERATNAEAAAGADTTRYVTPAQLKTAVDSVEGVGQITRYESPLGSGTYPARGTAATVPVVWVGEIQPPTAAAGSGTNFVTSATAMAGVDFFDRVMP